MHPPSVATLREGQRCRALGGRIPMDWVATFLRIAWQLCRGLGGNFPADWVAEFRGIRSQRNVPLYLEGLLSHLGRKNAEEIATFVHVERQVLQDFIGTAPWDHRPLVKVLVGLIMP